MVRVYWFSSDRDANRLSETARHLEQIAFRLRHELSQLKVIGVVPTILFVKDKAVAANAELDKRMLDADYGEDHVPTVRVTPPKPELVLYAQLPEDLRRKVLEAKEDQDEEAGVDEEEDEALYSIEFPPMKQNVLGLNHGAIMSRVGWEY